MKLRCAIAFLQVKALVNLKFNLKCLFLLPNINVTIDNHVAQHAVYFVISTMN